MRWCSPLLALCLATGLWAGEPIRIATASEWTTLNPLLLSQDVDAEATDLLFDRLVTMDAEGNFIPEMLESWTGLQWHDGRPIEAEDLVFTWRALKLPRVRAVADTAGGIPSFDRVVAEGPLVARIHLARPRGTILSDLCSFIPVPRRHYEVPAKPLQAAVNFNPVGSGPYRVVGQATAKKLSLERWSGYRGIHGGLWPAFELSDTTKVESKEILPAVEHGRFHYFSVGPLRYYLVRKGGFGDGMVEAVSLPQAAVTLLFLNCDPHKSLLGEKAIRRALAELIPWKELARGIRFLPARRATSFWPPEMWSHDSRPQPLPSQARAVALLDAAGWVLGPDGLRHNAQGKPLVLVGYDPEGAGKRSSLQLLAASALQVGVRIQVQEVSAAVFSKKSTEHEGDIWSNGWIMSLDPDLDSPLFTKEGYLTKANLSGYLNPVVDRLFDEGRHTLDLEARKKIYLQISAILQEDVPLIPVTYQQSRILTNHRLQGVTYNKFGQSTAFWPGRRAWKLEN